MPNTDGIIRTHVRAFTHVEDRFAGYRSTTIDGVDPHEAIAEIRRVDMVAPPSPQNYLCFHVETYMPGRRGKMYWLGPDAQPVRNPPKLWAKWGMR